MKLLFRIFLILISPLVLLIACVPDRFVVQPLIYGNPTEKGYQADKWKECGEQNDKECQ